MRRWVSVFLGITLIAALVGCSGQSGTSSQPQGGSTQGTTQQSEQGTTSGTEQIKLVFWDTNNSGVLKDVVEQLAAEFEQQHPGVKVEHRGWTTEELQKSLQRAVSSGEGPDIAQINNGESSMGPMVRAGLLVPMDQYDEKYGWSKRIAAGLLARNRYTDDGQTFGTGTLWGVSQTGEIIGFYYNRQIFAENGVSVPTTFDELEAAFETFKQKGVTPIVLGNLDKWPAIHVYGDLQGAYTTLEYLDQLIYHQGNQTWETDDIIVPAQKLQEWVQKGYLMENFAGVGYDDAWKIFANGGGATLLAGSWLSGDLAKAMGENVGFFLMPDRDRPTVHVGGVGLPYGIIKTTKHQDLAAEFINFLVSDRAVELLIANETLPGLPIGDEHIKEGTLSGDLYRAWNYANQTNTVGHYMDWATPTFYDTLTASLQALMAGEMDPEGFARELQRDYAAFLATKQ